ncbi:MAG: hypothetical protein BWX64_02783 [Acidobacteria bacterium ADurb.Bin051]|nr:MAG: hypothetical protein BWX64_02783 [Acidobacteria bacterium ADurb.Bin051]
MVVGAEPGEQIVGREQDIGEAERHLLPADERMRAVEGERHPGGRRHHEVGEIEAAGAAVAERRRNVPLPLPQHHERPLDPGLPVVRKQVVADEPRRAGGRGAERQHLLALRPLAEPRGAAGGRDQADEAGAKRGHALTSRSPARGRSRPARP